MHFSRGHPVALGIDKILTFIYIQTQLQVYICIHTHIHKTSGTYVQGIHKRKVLFQI